MSDHIIDFGISWYWALTMALVMLIFGLRQGLWEELRKHGWFSTRVNRLTCGLIVFAAGAVINTATWGAHQTALDQGLAIVDLTEAIAFDLRAVSRPLQTIGALLAISGVSDSPREWLLAWGAVALVFFGSLLLTVAA